MQHAATLECPRCGIIEKNVLGSEISAYQQLFAGLQKHATGTVDDRPVIVRLRQKLKKKS
jgi:hypothetical protein